MGYAEGPHGGSMGVAGGVADRGDVGQSNQKGYDYGFEGAASDTSTMEGFRAALAKALGQVTQEQKNAAVEAQNNLDANNRAAAAMLEARDKTQRETKEQKEREALESEIDALMDKTNFEVPGTKTTPTEFDPQNPYGIEDPNVIDNKGWTSQLDESQFDDPFNEEEVSLGPKSTIESMATEEHDVDKDFWGDLTQEEKDASRATRQQTLDSSRQALIDDDNATVIDDNTAAIDAFRDKEKGLMGATLDNIARTDKEKEVSKNRTLNLESAKALMEEFEKLEKEIKELERIPFKERTWAQHTELGKKSRALNEAKNTTRYRTAYATVHGKSMLGKAIMSLAPLGLGWWGPKLSQLAIDNGFIDTSTMADIARDIENSVNKAEPMPDALKKFFVRAEPWAASLTNQQIKYYLDRPEELEWVRNLWSSMNPTTAV